MKIHHEVTAIDPGSKKVSVKNLETGEEFEESYDKLILSPGARAAQPEIPGVGLERVFTMRTVKILFASKNISVNISRSQQCWREVGLLDWNWQKI